MKLVLFPGLGGSHLLFDHQATTIKDIECRELEAAREGETLSHYAQRIAKTFDQSAPFAIGGMSFGGMLSLELARFLPTKAVFLIASTRTDRGIRKSFQALEYASRIVPDSVLRWSIQNIAKNFFERREMLAREDRDRLITMANEFDVELFRPLCEMAAHWQFDSRELSQIKCPIFQIHGDRDPVIPFVDQDQKNCEVVRGGTHLITYTHRDHVNEWIQRNLEAIK